MKGRSQMPTSTTNGGWKRAAARWASNNKKSQRTRVVSAASLAALIPLVCTAATIDRASWIGGMETAIPTMFCASSQYFRQCFSVSPEECEETSASAARVCLSRYRDQIPEVLNQPQDGQRLGQLVGQCAGSTYEIALAKKRTSTPKCNDPANWR